MLLHSTLHWGQHDLGRALMVTFFLLSQGNSGGDGPAGPPGERVSLPDVGYKIARAEAGPKHAGWASKGGQQ